MGSSNAKVAPDFADVRSSAAREGVLPSEWEVLRRESSSWRRLQTVAPRGVNLPPDIQDHEAHVKDLERFLRRMALRPKKFTQSVEQKRIRTFGEDYAEEAAFPRQMGRSWGSLRVLGKLKMWLDQVDQIFHQILNEAPRSEAFVVPETWAPKMELQGRGRGAMVKTHCFSVQYAKSSMSTCRVCMAKIVKDSLRVGHSQLEAENDLSRKPDRSHLPVGTGARASLDE
eukprot:g15380.t1